MVLCACCKSHRTMDEEEQSHSMASSSMPKRGQDLGTLKQTLHECWETLIVLLFIVFICRVGFSIYMSSFFSPVIWMEGILCLASLNEGPAERDFGVLVFPPGFLNSLTRGKGIVIYLSTFSRPSCISFFCSTHENILWRMSWSIQHWTLLTFII